MKAIARYISFETDITSSKADLRLCAIINDIKIGDEVFHPKKKITKTLKTKDCVDLAYGRYVKILGEISPQATWVKDGDEIDVELYTVADNSIIETRMTSAQGEYLGTCSYVPHPDFAGSQRIKYVAKLKPSIKYKIVKGN